MRQYDRKHTRKDRFMCCKIPSSTPYSYVTMFFGRKQRPKAIGQRISYQKLSLLLKCIFGCHDGVDRVGEYGQVDTNLQSIIPKKFFASAE